jgi:hypothetical protein
MIDHEKKEEKKLKRIRKCHCGIHTASHVVVLTRDVQMEVFRNDRNEQTSSPKELRTSCVRVALKPNRSVQFPGRI